MNHLSLCSGIGGLDLAAEWAGFRTVAHCEIDEYASKVLAKNFKGVPNLYDIRTITSSRLIEHGINPDEITVISAGFPCQPYSLAGKGRGDCDERDLWGEVARVLGEVRPRWFVGENTPGLFSRENQRYFRRILSDLTALGYRVSWGIWGACDVGAPHKRDRVFIVANRDIPDTIRERGVDGEAEINSAERGKPSFNDALKLYREVSNADRCGQQERGLQRRSSVQPSQICGFISNARSKREIERRNRQSREAERFEEPRTNHGGRTKEYVGGEWWEVEPDVGRVAHGVSARVDRLRCLGNAVVPYQAYPIFEAIAKYENEL